MTEMTIAELRQRFDGTPQSATLDYVLAQNHGERLSAVQKAVDFACNFLEQHKPKKQNYGEDQISLEICEMLQMAGFEAHHDTYVGGHCDIVVRGKELFLWLAEAKKHSSYSWLDKGFQQLSRRYSTGVIGQDHGDILVYCYDPDAKSMIDKWREELVSRNSGVVIDSSNCNNPMMFESRHKHHASGLDFYVRHKAVALYWRPTDS